MYSKSGAWRESAIVCKRCRISCHWFSYNQGRMKKCWFRLVVDLSRNGNDSWQSSSYHICKNLSLSLSLLTREKEENLIKSQWIRKRSGNKGANITVSYKCCEHKFNDESSLSVTPSYDLLFLFISHQSHLSSTCQFIPLNHSSTPF